MKTFIYKNGGYLILIAAIIVVTYLRIYHPELKWD